MKGKVLFGLVLVITLLVVPVSMAQYPEGSWYTSYQIQNLGTVQASVSVIYYNAAGTSYPGPSWTINPNSSVVWTQWDDTSLPNGQYSAVIESTEPIAVIANQQLVPTGATSFNPIAPFSSYSGFDAGATSVTLPVIMHNWYGYYTEFYVQNVGSAAATVNVTFYPGTMNGSVSGASGVTASQSIPQFASKSFSQQNLTTLGAPAGNPYAGRFLGSAVVTSTEPLAVVVNQHNTAGHKLFTYNGFVGAGQTAVGLPNYMRGHYGYYSSMTIANPSATQTANVTLQYNADSTYSIPAGGTVSASFSIAPRTALVRYDGPGASDAQSDLDDSPVFTRFFGAVRITSDIPVVAMVNQEAVSTGDAQAGTYNGMSIPDATTKISVPLIQADFYGYYTSLTIQNTSGSPASIQITYTSDGTYSAVPNTSKTYNHTIPANGLINIYEGRKGGVQVGDINSDPAWRSGTNWRFMGSAVITSNQPIIAFVNEEKDTAGVDTMYTYNAINLVP